MSDTVAHGNGQRHEPASQPRGDVDIAAVGAVLADPARCRMLLALGDGRALPASRLAAEAAVSPSTASSHLRRLVDADLVTVEQQGRHRFHRLAGPQVGRLIEVLTGLAPTQPIRSLRQGTRANALREARTCYDHLAGRLGVALMRAMLDRDHIIGGDGTFDPDRARADRLSAYGHDVDYRLTDDGRTFLTGFGVELPPHRPTIRYCVDWSEQRHHLAGALGSGLLARLTTLDWIDRAPGTRAVQVTERGASGLAEVFGIEAVATRAPRSS